MPEFCHLHCHTQYSLLDGASDIPALFEKAAADGQKAVALTDHGNMFGAFKFVAEAKKKKLKPIVGCEFYLVEDRFKKSFSRSAGERDRRYHQLLLAKNKQGYENLSKLCSVGFTEGLYMKYPRIDKSQIEKFHEGLIATSCCIGAEIPQLILKGQEDKAEEALKWWLNIFGEDFYIELQRHRGLESIDDTGMSQEDVNQVLIRFAEKYNVKTIATNDAHYLEEDDWQPHDFLLCINTGSKIEDEKRMRFPSSDFYFKSQEEMSKLFSDVPQAIDNTMEIYSKVEELELARDVILPKFPIPAKFNNNETAFLRHLTLEGAKKRYGQLSSEIETRINFELEVIDQSGYGGYFLIVQDFTSTARHLGVSVGPGRGSAAGSVVAYCLGITNIDPIKYNLLFERFLNPERISMPDIDIDFDDEGRSKVIDYVIDKYGKNQVAQIITYSTLASKVSLKDVGRVLDVPLNIVNGVTKQFPSHLGASLNAILEHNDINKKLKEEMNKEDVDKAYKIRELAKKNDEVAKMINTAKQIEGSIRNTGIHACGVIITPDDITNYIPVATAKDSDLLVSQFDNSVVEDAGLLKMDFLGLKTLTIIKDAVDLVQHKTGKTMDIDEVDLEDELTYKLFQEGHTAGIFQYESPGMRKHLRNLKPTKFEDLIAMNALYRPGPMQYIDDFIKRKHGLEEIIYDLPAMQEHLEETYGITVYQEQVMLLSQKLAGFSKGQADMLRKAMGKKKKKIINEMWPIFLEGCLANDHPEKEVTKIWSDWEKFASYAFNKSHSTCYAFIAFQTAYLKANYPQEFMAAVLNHNKNDITKVNFYLRECKRMKIKVLGPDVNESRKKFIVNDNGAIRFGLTALKGVGAGPVEELIREREEAGTFSSIFDVTKRVSLRAVNKKCLESLALSGGLDAFGLTRAQYFAQSGNYETLIEHAIKYGNQYQDQKNDSNTSLFGDISDLVLEEPKLNLVEEWVDIIKLEKEKEITGIYMSGHPLDNYKLELEHYVDLRLDQVTEQIQGPIKIAGLVTDAFHGISKGRGLGYARFTIQDYDGSFDAGIYRENYASYKDLIQKGQVIFIEGHYARWKDSENAFFKIKNIKLLDTLTTEITKCITIRMQLDEVTDDFINQLEGVCLSNSGEHLLKLRIVDEELSLDFRTEEYRINATSQFIDALKAQGLSYKLN